MKLGAADFRTWENKWITLLGMSGVGKTHLSDLLMQDHWFHYSGDYRIGTRYLDEAILDNIKLKAMEVPFLRDLLRTDSIYINNNISVYNLQPVATFLGKLGDPELGGLPLKEFKRRQELHRLAEIAAMKDVPDFIRKAADHLATSTSSTTPAAACASSTTATSSRCSPPHADPLHQGEHARRGAADAARSQRPQAALLPRGLPGRTRAVHAGKGRRVRGGNRAGRFRALGVSRLFYARIPRYERIAAEYGYTVTTDELATVRDEASFLRLVEQAVARGG